MSETQRPKVVVDVNSNDIEGRVRARLLARVIFMHLQVLSLSPCTMQGGLYEYISPLRGLTSSILEELDSCSIELHMPSDPHAEFPEDVHGVRSCCHSKQKLAADKFSPPMGLIGKTVICPTCHSVWEYEAWANGCRWVKKLSCV